MDCLNEKILSSYLDEKLNDAKRHKIEAHISKCNHCLDLLLVAYEAQKTKVGNGHGRSLQTRTLQLRWLLGALFLFILSFIFRKYFLQFLGGAVILGFKWVMEGGGAKRVVMIFRGMHRDKDIEGLRKNIQRNTLLKP